jgi:hypothetical protein
LRRALNLNAVSLFRTGEQFRQGKPNEGRVTMKERVEAFYSSRGRTPTAAELVNAYPSDYTKTKRGAKWGVAMIEDRGVKLEFDDRELENWISFNAFQKRVQSVVNELYPGESKRGRPKKV